MAPAGKIRQAILGVSGIALFSKIFGFMREMVIAERFGTSHEYDVLLIAITVPIFFNLVVANATIFLAVPFLSRQMTGNGGDRGWRSFWEIGNSLCIIVALIVVGIVLAAPVLVRVVGPNLAGAELTDGIFYCRAIAAVVFLTFLESYFRSALNVKKEFVYPAAGTIILNIIAIAAIYLFSGKISVMAIILGLLAGAFCQALFQFARLTGFGVIEDFHLRFWGRDTKSLYAVGAMIIIVEFLSRTYFMIDRYFAGGLQIGVVSALNYSSLLVMLPVNVAGMAIAAVAFPYLSDRAADSKSGGISDLLGSTIHLSLVVGVPCGLFYLVFAQELTAAVFLRGAFNLESLEMTSRILIFLVPHLISLFLYSIFIQACYASGRQKFILGIAVAAIIIKILLTGLLKNLLGYIGIALATSIVEVLILIMISVVLIRDGNMSGMSRYGITILKIAAASVPMIPVAMFIRTMPDFGPGLSLLSKFRVVPAFFISLAGFIAIGYLVKIEEVRRMVNKVRGAMV